MFEALWWCLKTLWMLGGVFFTCVGLFTFFHLLRPSSAPVDSSNRINRLRLWWFCLTREELFVDTFPWLRNDELDNIEK